MSDDDLWRRPGSAGDERAESTPPGAASPGRPEPPADDASRPNTGDSGAAPDPSYLPPPGPGAVPPATNPYDPRGQQSPYGPPPTTPYPQPGPPGPYGGSGYVPPRNPYPAPHEYGAPQSPYGAPYQAAYAGGQLPEHPSATTAMVLGIIGLVGIVLCLGLTLVLSPAAWVVGAKAVREIDASPGRYGARDRAQAGKIMGIIGTVLLVLGVLAIIALVAIAVTVGGTDPSPVPQSPGLQNG
jgi:hypothetical protein